MNILVDSGLKKKIQIENRKNRRGIYYLWLFEKISFALVIAYIVLFPMVDSNIKINDYFTPSLYEILKSKIN